MRDELGRFGYTEREAGFLRLSALLSGYFLRGHFNSFIGRECGALAQRFLQRGLSLGHLESIPASGGRVVYHVKDSSLYRALGDPQNRNRRRHQADTVRRRLMAIDLAILSPGATWLLTEKQKVNYFLGRGIAVERLPVEVFPGAAKSHFVDRQPIDLLPSGTPRFGFVDEGLKGMSKWEQFLRIHRALLQGLSGAEVVFASCETRRFRLAEEVFRRTIAGETSTGQVDLDRLGRYFSSRTLFTAKRFESFDQTRLDELRESKRVFAGEEFDHLYERWLAEGPGDLLALGQKHISFRTQKLPSFYEWLSPIRFHERRA